ncbi:uncharacterized protein LOC123298650 [Chrysoperla carnea]|uniref:uncharacterized protein LOC123298650 n=1 Tax=Chrysoperla carnea TaxID=189513 RepID=UPI001D0898EC|nr:uncharacterized protein LOC123298650 [Chrysoperla carnea]
MGVIGMDGELDGKKPNFVTPGQTYRIVAGATVVLPCRVTETGNYILVWKRGIAVLTAGPMKVTPDPRVRLLSTPQQSSPIHGLSGGGYSLELKDVRPQDAGDYVCQIGTLEPIEITHTNKMPRRRTVTGRKERDRNRSLMRDRRTRRKLDQKELYLYRDDINFKIRDISFAIAITYIPNPGTRTPNSYEPSEPLKMFAEKGIEVWRED